MIINFLFSFFLLLLVLNAFMIILVNHPVFSLLFLISSFIFSSFLLFLLECELLAFLFVIVYVGAIAVLFLFAVMLLEIKFINLSKNVTKYLPVGLFFGLILVINFITEVYNSFGIKIQLYDLYLNIFQNWYDLIDSIADLEVYSQILYSSYVLQFLTIGLLLLMVLVGVVYLTTNTIDRTNRDQVDFKQLAREPKFLFTIFNLKNGK